MKIAGVDVIADMVAGSAADSVQSLLQEIKNKAELVNVIEGVVRDDASLTLTAATENADPLLLDATQDYQGEQQQATLKLETDGQDGVYDSFADGFFTNRGASVYYQGGKAYVNIRGAGPDGSMGTGDDVSVTVDAPMGADAITTSQNLVDAINLKVIGTLTAATPAVFTVSVTGLIERFANSGSVRVQAGIQTDQSYKNFIVPSVTTLADLLKIFTDVPGVASATLNDAGDLLTISSVATGASASITVYVNISSFSTTLTTYADLGSLFQPVKKTGQDSTISNQDPVLSQLLQGAQLMQDGIITLTAKQYAKETFEISDVTLDYQGVKQLASITLDSGYVPYGSTFTDGKTPDNTSYGRGANVYYNGGKAYVTISGAGVDRLVGTGDDVSVTVEALMGVDAIATRQNLVDAINAKVQGGSLALSPVLSQVLQGAELMQDGSIVLTAKNAGRETFTVSDVTLDYQGQTQQAKATYSTTNADYYAGGTLSLTVDTTPKDLTDGAAGDVTVTADMVAGNAASSILALKTAIEAELQVQQATAATPAVITLDVSQDLTDGTKNYSAGYKGNQFFVDDWYLKIQNGSTSVFLGSGGGSAQSSQWFSADIFSPTSFANLGAFVTYLDGLGETADAFDATLESGNLVITSRAKGADVNMTFALTIQEYGAAFLSFGELVDKRINNLSQPGFTAGSDEVIGSNGRLTNVLSEVSVDANGVITLTSKDKTEHAFDISKAEISYPGVKQVSEIVFDGLNDDNFYTTDDAGNQGTISISIAGTKVTANMGDTLAATLQSLATRIEALRDGAGVTQDSSIAAAVGTVAVINDKLVLTAAAVGVDPLKVDLGSFSITTPEVYGKFHKVTIQFSNTTLDSAAILGETLSITLNGLTTQLTVDQALLDSAGSLDRSEYLVGKLLDKVIADHTQAGTTNLDLVEAATARQGNLLTFQASKRGVGLLDVATASVTINDGAGTSQTAALLEVVEPGVDDTPASTSSVGITLNDATDEGNAVTGENADPVAQTISNPGDNPDLFGDSPLTGTAGVQQDFVNPRSAQDTLNGGNPGFFGDDPSSQAGDPFALGGAFSQGNAIEVTMFRETQWNDASATQFPARLNIKLTFSDSLQSYVFNGVVDKFGSGLGSDNLSNDYPELTLLRGGNFATAVSKLNDVLSLFETRVGRELGSITYDALTRKVTMAAVEGVTVSPGEFANQNDVFFDPYYYKNPFESVSLESNGTAQGVLQPGESFDASIFVKSPDGGVGQSYTNPGYGFNGQPDSPANTVGNPNPGNGDLYGSDPGKYTDTGLNTTSLNGGTVTGAASGNTQVYGYGVGNNPTDRIDLGNGSTTTDGGTAGKDAGSLTNSTSETDAFEVKTDTTGFAPFEWNDSILTVRSTGGAVADVVNNFQTASDLVALEAALLQSTVDGVIEAVVAQGLPLGLLTPDPGQAFNLSTTEFGLLGQALSDVTVADLSSSTAVSDALNRLFNFDLDPLLGGTSDNGTLNTTVFAVTAADNANVTAIWAHTQSTTGDNTVDSFELNLLATVNTLGNEFGIHNFMPKPVPPVLPV